MSSTEHKADSSMSGSIVTSSQRLGHPVLTTWDCIAQSLSIGPIFSAAFVAFLIAGIAAGAAPLAVVVGAIGVFALGYVVSLYARRYQGAGAVYDYLRRTSPALGVLSAGMYFIGAMALDTGGFLIIGLLIVQTLTQYLNINLPWWLGSAVALIALFAINHFGIKLATRVQLTLTTISVIPLLILAVAIIAKGGDAGNTLQAFNPGLSGANVFGGVLFAILLFVGFETAASLGEETANPQRSIPRAVLGTVALTTVFFLVMVYACDIGFGLNHADKWATDSLALDHLATRYVGSWLAVLIDIAVLLDALAVMSAFMATSARGWFALSRAGLLPRPLATQSRYRTPLGGNLLVLVVAALVIIVTAFTQIGMPTDAAQGNLLTQFGVMSTLGSLLIEVIYVILAVVAVRFALEEPGKWWRWIVLLVAIVTPLLGLYGSVVPFPPAPNNIAVYGTLIVLVLGGIWAAVLMRTRPAEMQKAKEDDYAWEGDEPEPALY